MKRCVLTLFLALALFALAVPHTADAAAYPNKPIVVVIPFGPGGSHDLHARGITSIMADILEQPMIVKLLPGGAGMKATGFVANSRPDGYTILFTHNGIDMIVPQTRKVPFNTQKAFKTIAKINHSNPLMITLANSKYKTFKAFIEDAKKNPGQINVGHSGVWGSSYTTYMTIAKATGIKVNLIPHKGGGPLMRATLAGRIAIGFASPPQAIPHLKSGKLRALAVVADQRITSDPVFKDVPSSKELGYPGLGFTMERIFMAPSNTPADRMETLKNAFTKLTKHRSFKRFMRSIGMPVQFMRGEDYDKIRPMEYKRFTTVIKAMTKK
jgi:tripartite-type tricarboxylate transporter receptor subunit TctC